VATARKNGARQSGARPQRDPRAGRARPENGVTTLTVFLNPKAPLKAALALAAPAAGCGKAEIATAVRPGAKGK